MVKNWVLSAALFVATAAAPAGAQVPLTGDVTTGTFTNGRANVISADSVQLAGTLVRYLSRGMQPQNSTAGTWMLADCSARTRGVDVMTGQSDVRMYGVYSGTVGGDELNFACVIAAQKGLLTHANTSTAESDKSRALDSDQWVAVSGDGSRKVRGGTLRLRWPQVAYRFFYGPSSTSFVSHLQDFLVEVDCERRLRRDVLWNSGVTPNSQFVAVDSWGEGFREELDAVCNWARAKLANTPSPLPPPSVARTEPEAPSRAPAPGPAPAPSARPTTPNPNPTTPAIRRTSSSGSGFVVGTARVVTNHHVVEECESVLVRFEDQTVAAEVVATNRVNDLALLRTEQSIGAAATLRAAAALGEEVTIAGYPLAGLLGTDLIVTSGQVNSLAGLGNDPTTMQVSAPVQPGNSGGPLVDRSGNVVGVVVSKLNVERLAKVTGDMAQNVNFAIKPEILRLFLGANRVQYKTSPLGIRLDGVQIAGRARQFTVQVLCIK